MNDVKCERCKKYEDCSTGSGLVWPCGAYDPKFITNAEKIRAMTDEELVEILYKDCCDTACAGNCQAYSIEICKAEMLKWLRQPAEED